MFNISLLLLFSVYYYYCYSHSIISITIFMIIIIIFSAMVIVGVTFRHPRKVQGTSSCITVTGARVMVSTYICLHVLHSVTYGSFLSERPWVKDSESGATIFYFDFLFLICTRPGRLQLY